MLKLYAEAPQATASEELAQGPYVAGPLLLFTITITIIITVVFITANIHYCNSCLQLTS